MDEQLIEWLVLQQIKGLGLKRLSQLLEHFPSPNAILKADSSLLDKMPESIAQSIREIQDKGEFHLFYRNATQNIEKTYHADWHILSINHPQYPKLLTEIPYPPPILYVKGDLACLSDTQLGVVGARKSSKMGVQLSFEWSKQLAQSGLVITSGLAIGIDGAAHQGAIEGAGKTIAVLAHGLENLYPQRHKKLADSIVEQGALVTEFAPSVGIRKEHFPRRNRIISGLSQGILVIEAAEKSGSLITAQYAVEQNREVFAIPGSIANPMSAGCHRLIQQGACLVTKPSDILASDIFEWCKPDKSESNKAQTLDQLLAALLDNIPFDFTHFDVLLSDMEASAPELNAALIELEMLGFVENLLGSYRRIK
ncbi:MAG: DNA-processing protein DprA [Cellvibrionales bacterium]|nr:DNA-processing protein DprA [Cellvibrionales bacterium]